MEVSISGNRFVVQGSELEKSETLKLPGAGPLRDGNVSMALNFMSYRLLSENFKVDWSEDAQHWLGRFEDIKERGRAINNGEAEPEWDLPDLWETQKLAIQRIMDYGSAAIFDDRGMGKTRTVLEVIRRSQTIERRPALIVTSRRLRSVWRRDCADWWDASEMVLPEGKTWSEAAAEIGSATITVVTYQSLMNKDVMVAIKKLDPYFTVIEEAHNVKKRNKTNVKKKADGSVLKRTPTLSGLVRSLPGTCRLVLTGTPTPNYWHEAWPLLNFVSPKEFSSFWTMIETVGKVTENFWGGKDIDSKIHRMDIWKDVWDRWVIRRERQGRTTIWDFVPVELSRKEKLAYQEMHQTMRVEREDQTLDAKNQLDQATKLQQLAGGYGTWDTFVDSDGIMKSKYKISEPSSKTETLIEMLEGLDRAVVFTRFRDRANFVAERINAESSLEAIVISGGQTEKQTDDLLDRFARETSIVAVCVFGTVSEGRNELVAAQDIFFLDWITATGVDQAVDRLDRPGQKGQVRAVTLYAEGTIDELTIDRERRKVIPLRRAIGSKLAWSYLVDTDPFA